MSFWDSLNIAGNAAGAITSIVGLLGGASQARQGGGLAAQGQRNYDEAVTNSRNAYNDALKTYQNQEAAGAYNADQALRLLGDQASHDLTLKDKNTAGQLATLGYKRGDSPFAQDAAHNSESANLQLRQDLLNTQNLYDQKQQSALNNVNSYRQQLNNALMNVGGQDIARGTSMQSSGLNTIGNAVTLLGGQRGGTQSSAYVPPSTGSTYYNAYNDTNPYAQYDQYGRKIDPFGFLK